MYPPPCTCSHIGGGCQQELHKWGLGGKRGRGNANTVRIPPPLFTPHSHATLQAKGEGTGGWGECPFFPCVSIHVDALFTQFSIYKVT